MTAQELYLAAVVYNTQGKALARMKPLDDVRGVVFRWKNHGEPQTIEKVKTVRRGGKCTVHEITHNVIGTGDEFELVVRPITTGWEDALKRVAGR